MGRYVIFCRNTEHASNDLPQITGTDGVKVLEEVGGRSLLVEASEEAIAKLRSRLKHWTIADEVTYPRPGRPRESIKTPKS